ncbi:chemokine (C-X-C motif) ligand 18a, duplicate 1 isoform X1 [Scleropages formosus]|uniref:chemokine (C-X-C motif) ligand 18a, duplicate 1 isoform X1 n=1 Tax=Scleropages formosus TaxID=113540 RepID=UPI0008789922|nr:alveolar macrophage chemotactic factor 2-like isoform X1 [Scleropages formosus]
MDYRSPAAVLIMLVLLCGGDLNTGSGVLKAMSIRERCECLETVDKLTWRQITDFQVTPRSELCNSVQIVVHLKTNQKVCLNPESRQGKKIQNCWNRRTDGAEKRRCPPFPPK